MKKVLLTVLSAFLSSLAWSVTYTLPADTGTGPFALCVFGASTVSCAGNVTLGNNDDIVLTENITLSIGGSFNAGNNLVVNDPELFTFSLSVGGNININNGAQFNGDITAGASISFGNSATVVGDITAGTGGTINLGNSSSVTGTCTATGGNYPTYCSAAAPGIGTGVCYDFNSGLPSGWTGSGSGEFGVNGDTGVSGSDSLYLRSQAIAVATSDFDLSSETQVDYTVWVRRGDDSFSEDPDNGEDLQLEYRDDSGTWQILTTYIGQDTNGEIFTPTFTLSGTQLHNNFALRFNKIDGNNGDWDYWHIDDVCLTPVATVTIPTPVIEYRFDELTWDGTTDEVEDSSGNGNDGTADLATATTTDADAVMCQAASFDGAGQHIDTPNLTTLEGTSSLSFWIKTTQTGNSINWSSPMLTGVEESGGQNDIFWGWINEAGNIGLTQSDDANDHSSIAINDDAYHHVVLTFDEPSRSVSIYIDGALDRTYTTGGDSIDFSFNQIGYAIRTGGGTPAYLDALVDEFLVFDQVLSSAQANQIYTLQSAGRNLDGSLRICNNPLTPIAWFTLDEISAGQYPDDSGNNFNIDTVGSATPVDESQGRICAANEIGNNNSQSEIDGLLTDIQFGLGGDVNETGSVSFWFNSTNDWDGFGQSRILFDASSGDDFFTLQLDSSGRLEFAFEDDSSDDFQVRTNATGFSANSWHHVSVAWNLPAQSVEFYIDGASVSSSLITGSWGNYDNLPALNLLLFGDARNNDSLDGIDQSANGRFDEIYVFDSTLGPSQALQVYNETHPCPIQPLAYYRFEEAAWTGAADEVQDETVNDLDLTNDLNNGNLTAGRVCTGVFFDGVQGRMSRANDPVLDDYSAGMGATVWINPTQIPSADNLTIVNKANIFALRLSPGGELRLNYFDATATARVLFTSGANISPNSWTHVAFTVSPTVQRIWVDGNLLVDNNTPTTLIGTSTGRFQIGANAQAPSNSTFAGRIDEVRIYNQEITQTEVSRDLSATHSCDTSLVGWYHLEEASYNGTPGEVIDYSGNRNNGFSEGATARATGYLCYGATIPQNNSQAIREGIETNVDLDSDLGDQGTIMLWYNSAEDWDTGRNRLLIDASTDTTDPASGDNKYFFLEILSNGALRYQFEDRDDDNDFDITEPLLPSPRPGGQWYHVAVTWDYTIVDSSANPNFQIFVDGVMVANTINARNSNDIDGQPNYQRVHFGDNASNYNYVPDASANGVIDEMRLYNRILTSAEIVTASGETHPCAGEAIVRYQFDQLSWDGTPDEVIDDSGFNYDAVTFGTVNPNPYTSTCRAADFTSDDPTPNTIHAIATPMDVDRDIGNEGSIMMWVQPDNDFGSFTAERNLFDASRNPREFYASVLATGEVKFVISDASNNQFVLTTAPLTATAEDWTHLAFTWSFSGQEFNVYVDGVLAATSPGAGVFNIADLPTLYLGDSQNNRASGTNNSWSGWMEDARIYNYERTLTEVNDDINDFSPCVELVNHFDVDEWDNVSSSDATTATAINCVEEPIRIFARLADNSTAVSFNNLVRVEARNTGTNNLTGTWTYTGAEAFTNQGTGLADITLVNGSIGDGTDELFLEVLNPQDITINVIFNTVTETSGSATAGDDPTFTYNSSGLIISSSSGGGSVGAFDVIAGTLSSDLFIRAVESDLVTGACNPIFNGAVNIDMGTDCINPNICAAGQSIDFEQAPTSTTLPNDGTQSAVSTTFDASSEATYNVLVDDVGEHQHSIEYTYAGTDGPEVLSASITYFARPNSIEIFSRQNSSGDELDPSLSPNNTAIAGSDITLVISGRDAANNSYPSFNEIDFDTSTLLLDHYPVNWTSSLLSPGSGVNGLLSGGNNWSPSSNNLEATIQYSEIEEFRLNGVITDFWNGNANAGTYAYNLTADIATLVPAYLQISSQSTASWNTPLSEAYQGMTSTITGLTFDISAYNANDVVIENYDNTSPTFNNAMNVLAKSPAYSTVGGTLESDLAWTVNDIIDDDAITIEATFSDVIWNQNGAGPNVNDIRQIISDFALPLSALSDSSGLCIQANAAAPCDTGSTTIDTNDQWLSVARLSAPDQVNGTESSAQIPLSLEVLTSFSGTEPVFSVATNENELGIGADEIIGLEHLAGTTCTLQATGNCAVGARTPITLQNLIDSDNELAAGQGFLSYALTTDDQGILEVSIDTPAWLHWDWNGSGPEAPSTLLLFGEYQGQPPVLFIRPGFR